MYAAFAFFAEQQTKDTSPGFLNPQTLLMMAPIVIMLYLLIVVLPGRRRAEKERQEQLNKLNKNDEVLTIGGIYGTVTNVHETKDELTLKVDDGTRIRITKGSISRNITAEENAKKAKEAAKAPAAPAEAKK